MTKWEYTTLASGKFGSSNWGDVVDHGAEGWELISVIRHHDDLEFYFKRPLVEDVKYPWHDFTDGVIPALDAQIEIRRRNGTTDTGEASAFRWNDRGNEYDIVAWRLNG